jgi:methionyl-tRNA formyltransferase
MKKSLRIVFMGTPEFAAYILAKIITSQHTVVGVVTVPDKPAGRGQKIQQSAVKLLAVEHNIPLLQPEKLKDPAFIETLQSLKPDVQVVVAFRMLPEVVWSIPAMGTFNLHASLLPQYRGAAPINHAIINGETETGVTTFFIDHEIDTGSIIDREVVKISPEMNAGQLHDQLMQTGSELVLKTLDSIANETIVTIPQSEFFDNTVTLKHAPKIFKEDCHIDFRKPGEHINNLVRGLSPYPSAWFNLTHANPDKNLTCKVFEAFFEPGESDFQGKLHSDGKKEIKISCIDGWIHLTDIQIAGKKRMPIEDLLRGFSFDGYNALETA